MNYLDRGYGGSALNMYEDKCFYCYTIYDLSRNMYYSGVKSVRDSSAHGLGDTYFTSTTVTDFKHRFRSEPTAFMHVIEYFCSFEDACSAEMNYHKKYNVAKDPLYYNVVNSCGSLAGSGSLLCRGEGSVYRVSTYEYHTGKHIHVAHGRQLVRMKETGGIMSIAKDDFDPELHETQFKDHVLCKDVETGVTRRIPSDEFAENSKYVGITKGEVTVLDKLTDQKVTITSSEFKKNKNRYEAFCTPRSVRVIENTSGAEVTISIDHFRRNKGIYTHVNSLRNYVFDIVEKDYKEISKEELELKRHRYIKNPCSAHRVYIFRNVAYPNKILLSPAVKDAYGVGCRWTNNADIQRKFGDVKILTIEEYKVYET